MALLLGGCGYKANVQDGDGDGFTADEGDCWDRIEGPAGSGLTGEQINPNAEETWYDDVDQNCDGTSDYDADQDGIDALLSGGSDCDDADPTRYPGAEDSWYDGIDSDCGGEDDYDQDGDGYGSADFAGEDCDDGDAGISPVAEEDCDGVDEDCDGEIDDDAAGAGTWYADEDGDGYGDASSTQGSCEQPTGYVSDATDCDDSEGSVSPDGVEVCNEVDDDCDDLVDDADLGVSYTADDLWYPDQDADGYGDMLATDDEAIASCEQPPDNAFPAFPYALGQTDCNDRSPTMHPGSIEGCDDDLDSDCDGTDNNSGACEPTD